MNKPNEPKADNTYITKSAARPQLSPLTDVEPSPPQPDLTSLGIALGIVMIVSFVVGMIGILIMIGFYNPGAAVALSLFYVMATMWLYGELKHKNGK